MNVVIVVRLLIIILQNILREFKTILGPEKRLGKTWQEVNPVRNSSRCDSKPSGPSFLTG
jgi:hypothetical protein